MKTITITNQDHVETTSFQYGSCGNSQVYLNGLKEGEVLVSEYPFYIQNSNGVLAGVDQRFTTFKLVKNTEVISTVQLSWSNNCVNKTSELLSYEIGISPQSLIQTYGIPTLLAILSISFIYLIKRIRK
jgi:hypothetical protein